MIVWDAFRFLEFATRLHPFFSHPSTHAPALKTYMRRCLKGFTLKTFVRCLLKCRSCTPPFK
jgi:hypothetical protein